MEEKKVKKVQPNSAREYARQRCATTGNPRKGGSGKTGGSRGGKEKAEGRK